MPDYRAALTGDVRGLRIGIPAEYSATEGADPEVLEAVEGAVRTLEGLGAQRVPVSLPHTRYAVAVYYVVAPCEASSNLARYDGVKYGLRAEGAGDLLEMYRATRSRGFGPEVRRRIIIGTYCLSAGYYDAYYGKASQVRTLIVEDFKQAFAECDLIACPVAPTPAFRIGEKTDDPLTMYLSDIFTISANLAGIPAYPCPAGFLRPGCQSACRSWAVISARRPSSGRRTRSSRRRGFTRESRGCGALSGWASRCSGFWILWNSRSPRSAG